MLINSKLKDYQLILASKSPRRKMLLKQLDLDFETIPLSVDESFPKELPLEEVPEYLAKKKGKPLLKNIQAKQIILTADTVVILNNKLIGKPKNHREAHHILQVLSGQSHKVITGVCLTSKKQQLSVSVSTQVYFKTLTNREINYYVEKFNPTDKAGAYGAQEWIGSIAIERIEGSYSNVIGLPTATVYSLLNKIEL